MPFRGRLLAGLTASAYARAVSMLGQVVLVPVLLYAWGAKGYGEWLSLTALASYVSYSSVGLTPTVRADMSMANARGDQTAMRETYGTAFLSILGISGLVVLGLAISLHYFDFYRVLHISTVSRATATLLIWVLCGQIVLNIINGVVSSGLSAVGQYGLALFLDSTRQLLEFVCVIIAVLIFRAGFAEAAVIYPSLALAGLTVSMICLHRNAPWLGLIPTTFAPKIYGRLWRPMLGAFLLNFGYMGLVIQAPRLILAAAAGPAAVALFSVTTTLMRLARIGGELIAMPTAMEFSFAYGRGDIPLAQRLLVRATSLSVWLMILAAVPIIFLGPTFIHYWTSGRLDAPPIAIAAAMLGTIAYALGISSMQALQAVNRILTATIALILLAGPCLALGYVWSKSAGSVGMLASIAVLELGLSLAVMTVASRLLKMPMLALLGALKAPPIGLIFRELRMFKDKAARILTRS